MDFQVVVFLPSELDFTGCGVPALILRAVVGIGDPLMEVKTLWCHM